MSERVPEHVARLLTSSIESVERLDVLLHLRAAPTHTFSARAVARALRLATHDVEHHLAILCGRGFLTVSFGSDLLYAYKPISPAIAQVLSELDVLNRMYRQDVIATLQARDGKDPVRAFANAFLIRDTKKGGKDA